MPTDDSADHPAPQNPPLTLTGMTLVALDTRGRLVEFHYVPPQVESIDDPPAAPVDWDVFFKAAGLEAARFEPAAPTWTPRTYADARAAWIGTSTDLPDVPLRIEAASHAGRPVNFQIIGPWARPTRMQTAPVNPAAELIGFIAGALVMPLVFTGGALLARRNLRRGRGDRRGAVRLAVIIFGLDLARWLFAARHYPDIAVEQARMGQALSSALFAAAIAGLLYLAIEPHVRRLRPAMLVTWSRLVTGRFRDPLLGRDLVVGAVAGLAMTVITYAQFLLPPLFGWQEFRPESGSLEVLSGVGPTIGYVLGATTAALRLALPGAVGVILLRMIVPSFAAAFWLTVVLFSPLAATGQIGTERLWLDLLFGAALVTVVLGVTVRYGVVAGAAAFVAHFLTLIMPLTLDPARLLFGWSITVLAIVLAMAIGGVVLARGREPLLGVWIADQ